MTSDLKVALVSPRDEQCGVRDYSDYLAKELNKLVSLSQFGTAEFDPGINEADIIHIQHQYFLFGGVAPWKNKFHQFIRKCTKPVVLTAHEYVPSVGPAFMRYLIAITNRGQFGSDKLKRILVHTQLDKSRMVDGGLPANLISVVRHGIPEVDQLLDKEEAKRALGLEGKTVLTIFGFIARRKGHHLACEALNGLPEDVVLLIAGGKQPQDKTNFVEELKKMIATNPLIDKRVKITGYLDSGQVLQVMSATDIVLAPFTESSGSGSLALAIAYDKPIVASDIEPHNEILGLEPSLFASHHSGNVTSLQETIYDLINSPSMMKDLTAAANRYASKYSYSQMAADIVMVYREILSGSVS